MSYYLVTQYCCLVLSFIIVHFPKTPTAFAHLIYFQYPVSQWLFIIRFDYSLLFGIEHLLTVSPSVVCLVATLWITNHAKSEFITFWMIGLFSAIYPAYLVLTAIVGLYGHARQVSKYTNWNTTARG